MSERCRLVVLGAVALITISLVVTGVVVRRSTDARIWRDAVIARDAVPAAVSRVAPPAVSSEPRTSTVALRRGDSLTTALTREGVSVRAATEVAGALRRNGASLRKLQVGDTLTVSWTPDGAPARIAYAASPWLAFDAIADEDGGWRVEREETQPDVRPTVVTGAVTRSLFAAVDEIGESPQLVLDLVEIFESDFDFTADTRAGDRFRLLVEKRYAGETFVDYGRVLGAQYVTDGRVLTAVAYAPRGAVRPAYYDLAGRSLKKTFLKSPLEFSRITSGFTYARPHPILGGTRPHLAIDYAAPVGTPVRAVADATVTSAGWAGGNGISVKLRHRAGYETMYNHLSRAAVKPGARVRQREVIGYVGSTGLSTGPHLDFRVQKNGVWVNPLAEKFLPGEPISGADRPRFTERAHALVQRLETSAPF